MTDSAQATYGPDIVVALISTATFGGWGLAGAAVFSLARHSPVVREGVAQLAPQLTELRRQLPELLTSTPPERVMAWREPAAPQAHAPAAARPRWLEVVNDDMDRAPHTLILGPSGAGKTTLATAVMADRGGRSVVLTPKVAAGNWSGAEVITLDNDGSYAPLAAAMVDLEDEKRARVVALRQRGRDSLEPLTVVFDELQDLTTHVPEVGEFMVNMSSIGREIKMRLVGVGTTDDALNIRGWKASRRNYLRVEMDRDRRASLSDGVRTISVGTRDSLSRASAARLSPWRGEPEPVRRPVAADAPRAPTVSMRVPAPADDLLASLLAAPAPRSLDERIAAVLGQSGIAASGRGTGQRGITPQHDTDTDTDTSGITVGADTTGRVVTVNVQQVIGRSARRQGAGLTMRGRRDRLTRYSEVRALVRAGKGTNEIVRIVRRNRNEVSEEVRRAKRELGVM
jgi:hypothetical protein